MREKDFNRASDRIELLLLPLGGLILIGTVFGNLEPQSDVILFTAMCIFSLCVLQHICFVREKRNQAD